MPWGRYNTDAGSGGRKWLDSNDNTGIKWKIGGIGKFNAVTFFVIDAADVGGKFSIKVGDTAVLQPRRRHPAGSRTATSISCASCSTRRWRT